MAGVDQASQVFVGLGVGFPIVPGRDVQGGDPGFAPAWREVIQIDSRSIGGIKKRPQSGGLKRRDQTEVGERLRQVGEAVVSAGAGRGCNP